MTMRLLQVHESGCGTSRHFWNVRKTVAIEVEADIEQSTSNEPNFMSSRPSTTLADRKNNRRDGIPKSFFL